MAMPIREWDKKVAPLLQEIEYRASMLRLHSENLRENVERLIAQPNFDARAVDEIDRARAALNIAAIRLHEAREEILRKPVDV